MAPRKDQDDSAAEKIRNLCILMTSDIEFTPDLNVAAQGMNLAQAKNVTRKINSIIEPIGYTMKGRKIVKDDTLTTAASTTTSSSTPVTTTTDNSSTTTTSTKKTKTASKKAAAKTKTTAKSQAKKRKLEDSESESYNSEEADNDSEEEDSPATKAIKEAMAGSDVEPGDESSD